MRVHDRRATREVGRRARLELVFARRGDRTVVAHAYAEPPLRVGRGFEAGRALHVIMASTAPGIFGGDDFEQTIVVEAGACVRLTSQSAMQVHPAADGATARVASSFSVGAGATLRCHWDLVIPFPHASLRQRLAVDLAPDATLVWSDAMMAGREARGERWRFESVGHELAVRRGGGLVYLERHNIVPARDAPHAPWIAGDASYFGTVVVAGARATRDEAARLHAALQGYAGLRAAADQPVDGLVVARLAGASGAPFHAARRALESMLER